MSTLSERAEKTRQYILDPEVTFLEGLIHLARWFRFEMAIQLRDHNARVARRLFGEMSESLTNVKFRKDVKSTIDNLH